MAYIYIIRNNINNKVYIGKTNFSIEKRFKEHIKDSKKHRKIKRPLYNAMNKYGVENFTIEVLENCSVEEANEKERYWIKKYNCYENGYNATIGGDGTTFLDYKKIIKLYDETQMNSKQIAEKCNCSYFSVKNIVSQYRNPDWVNRENSGYRIEQKKVYCVEEKREFDSISSAGRWLVSIQKSKSAESSRNHISEVCNKKRKTHAGYHWMWI